MQEMNRKLRVRLSDIDDLDYIKPLFNNILTSA